MAGITVTIMYACAPVSVAVAVVATIMPTLTTVEKSQLLCRTNSTTSNNNVRFSGDMVIIAILRKHPAEVFCIKRFF